jgi:hypothetical protein
MNDRKRMILIPTAAHSLRRSSPGTKGAGGVGTRLETASLAARFDTAGPNTYQAIDYSSVMLLVSIRAVRLKPSKPFVTAKPT